MLRGLRRLNRYENRLFKLAKTGGKNVRIVQAGFSRRTAEGFRFPIYVLEIGTPEAIAKNPVGIVAGVHGLETIGIRVLLDFLEYIVSKHSAGYLPEISKGKLGIVCIPIVNPGGVAKKTRANPAGVDLMRNSGIEAEKAPLFFGGQTYSKKLPYFRGSTPEPEARILYRFIKKYFFNIKNSVMPVLDIHSGFGTVDQVWWPFAFTKQPCPDESMYEKIARYLKEECYHVALQYGPQSESYTTHGDLWDRLYLDYQNSAGEAEIVQSKFLPWTLEIGTWSDIRQDPGKIFRKRGIFNPSKFNKFSYIQRYRDFLRDFVKVAVHPMSKWG